ncbi:MAG: M28 family peptidase [Candidatus Marinimicrobia bacterium]|nr:M28 family peptidase [Candidatus Neomarinimicrobiota bacterium]
MKRILILMIILITFAFANEHENLQKDIKFLSSEVCFGRSISRDGIFHAEDYIVNELIEAGIDVQLQPVNYRLNLVLTTPLCVINGDTLRPGYDFIPHPFSSSVEEEFNLNEIELLDRNRLEEIKDSLDLYSVSSTRRYLLKKSKKKDRKTLLLFAEDDPIVSKQSKQYARPAFQVKEDILPDTIYSVFVSNDVIYKKVKTNNVIAVIEGITMPDSVICISAHYDHMGGLGDVYYPGANDNASGVAVLLALARYYAETPPPMTLVFCFFTGEEQGLKGSWKYTRHPILPLKNVMMALNLDMVGSGLGGYGLVGGNDWPADVSIFEEIREAYEMGQLKLRPNVPNSDHFPFTVKGVKAIFLYASGGEQPYHHPDDIPETLDWETMENTVLLIKEYIFIKANGKSTKAKDVSGDL